MAEITSVPHFRLRWTEPLAGLRKREHVLDVNIKGESDAAPLRGSITALSKDQLGPLPGGGLISSGRIVNDTADAQAASDLWRQVRADRITHWIPAESEAGKLDRSDLELQVIRGADNVEVYRSDIDRAAQPVQDMLSAAAKLHADIRLHG